MNNTVHKFIGLAAFAIALFSAHYANAVRVNIFDKINIDIPESFTRTYTDSLGSKWFDGTHWFVCRTIPNGVEYDINECNESLDRNIMGLSQYASFEHRTDGALEWYADYIERYFYHLDTKDYIACRTTYVDNHPYVLAYSFPASETQQEGISAFRSIADSECYTASWWNRLKRLFSQSWGMILIFPLFTCSIAYLASVLIKKKYLVTIMAIVFGLMGAGLWSQWDTAIIIYALWAVILALYATLDLHDFNKLVDSVNKAIP
ncbi:MAG: hypothetical protein JFR24_04005 [Muribaculaceae bacterium]|jgi:hypothetical protein|nr:hypothetical protein [Muribaculaceae bacterium]